MIADEIEKKRTEFLELKKKADTIQELQHWLESKPNNEVQKAFEQTFKNGIPQPIPLVKIEYYHEKLMLYFSRVGFCTYRERRDYLNKTSKSILQRNPIEKLAEHKVEILKELRAKLPPKYKAYADAFESFFAAYSGEYPEGKYGAKNISLLNTKYPITATLKNATDNISSTRTEEVDNVNFTGSAMQLGHANDPARNTYAGTHNVTDYIMLEPAIPQILEQMDKHITALKEHKAKIETELETLREACGPLLTAKQI